MEPLSGTPPETGATRAERVNQVYANEGAGLVGTALGAVVLALVQAPVCGRATAAAWCAVLLAVTGARLLVRRRWRRRPATEADAPRRALEFRAGVLLSGACWGSAALLFFPEASPAHQVFTAFIIAGIIAGAAAAYAPLAGAFPAFAVPAVAPILLSAALSDSLLHRAMAAMILVFCLFMVMVARGIRRAADSAIALKFENQGLVETLSGSIRETLTLNASLKAEIRERERTEAELQRHQGELEARVARRTEELSRANAELREALEAKTRMEGERRRLEEQLQLARRMEGLGTLAGGVAHDFNNLLMGIGGQVDLLLAGQAPDSPEAERLRAVERRVREGADLTARLLGLARAGKYEVRPVDPNDLVRKLAALFARTHRDLRVSTRLEEGAPAVDADRGQLEQALLNICLNARQAMPAGGTLDLTVRRARLEAEGAEAHGVRPGEHVVIDVADTGAGMDRSVLPRIFDPFFTTREPGQGAGLGLSSAYGIVRNHGGFIEVDSEPGRGSTFSVWLPRSATAAGQDGSQAGAAPGAGRSAGRGTVLVVDDEPMVSEVAAMMLQRLGLDVLRAMGGEEALALYREHGRDSAGGGIELVLLDMIMPGMGGEETFRRLRELDPEARVLLSSGYSLESRAQALLRAGCLGYLQKPYNLAELRAKLEEVLPEGVPAPAGPPASAP